MADTLFFSRDTEVFITIGSDVWKIPVLDGYSFSQATNTSEITLNEMADASGNSRRARQMFTDSYAPAEWSFSTYVRPFGSAGTGAGKASDTSGMQHAVEEVLWAMMVGDASYSSGSTSGAITSIANTSGSGGTVLPTSTTSAAKDAIAAKFPASVDVTIPTATDGGGSGAKITFTFTKSGSSPNRIITTTIGSATADIAEGGVNYETSDELFISIEAFAEAVANGTGVTATAAEIETLFGASADVTVGITAVGAGAGNNTFTGFTRDGTDLNIDFGSSNKTTLGTADIHFVMGGASSGTKVAYKIKDCVVNEASIDFDIDGIATINWSGFGEIITEDTAPTATITEGTTATSNFIRNRLTSLDISGNASSSVTYTDKVILTGGNVTISNNITYLTPETLGVVNQPIGHVTGTRSVNGNFTCYLNTETNSSADLFENIIEDTDLITNDFDLHFHVGGSGNTPRLELDMTDCHLEVPTHSIDDVISLEVNFHALPSSINNTDELVITYVGPDL